MKALLPSRSPLDTSTAPLLIERVTGPLCENASSGESAAEQFRLPGSADATAAVERWEQQPPMARVRVQARSGEVCGVRVGDEHLC